MLLDARTLPNASSHDADVCIVGAGAAGIAIARELAREGVRVCLLESGGLEPSRRAQALADGDRRGDPYPPLDEMRVRALGGTTARWTGWCRPLDAIDFEPRPWVPHAGWPFARAHLAPFYERAAALVEVSDAGGGWTDGEARDADSSGLARVEFRCSPPTHLGRAHRAELERSATAHVWLNATVVGIETAEDARIVSAVRVRAAAGREVRVRARCFVLAAGGIENARLLLASADGRRAALGDAHGLVGRFFMEHPHWWAGTVVAREGVSLAVGDALPHGVPGRVARRSTAFALAERAMRDEGLLNGAIRLVRRPAWHLHDAYDRPAPVATRRLGDALRRRPVRGLLADIATVARGVPDLATLWASRIAERANGGSARRDRLAVRAWIEQAPDPENRVTLSDRLDAHGQPLARLIWRLGDLERRTARRLVEIAAGSLAARGLEAERLHSLDVGGAWHASLSAGAHHMGTTRMHASPREGVVDADCRVHETANLFVAGSSVFPTGGHANPTLTLLALALRLAERLRAELAAPPVRLGAWTSAS